MQYIDFDNIWWPFATIQNKGVHMNQKMPVSQKIALIAKSKGFTQKKLAQQCDVSRITIHRFFNGQTQLKCNDLMNLLNLIGIDVETQLNQKLSLEAQVIELGHVVAL